MPLTAPHIGSWGTPDFGVTEWLQKTFQPNNSLTYQGGSNLLGAQPTPAQVLGDKTIQPPPTAPPPSGGGAPKPNLTTNQNNPTNNNPISIDPGEIDKAYSETENYLNGLLSNAYGGEQDFYKTYTAPYEAQKPEVESKAGTQTYQSQMESENAINSARRLYNEMSRGYQQRFGGSNSAGAFGQAVLGGEYQRNLGGINSTLSQNLQSIRSWKDSTLQTISTNTANALSQAKLAFQGRIDTINGMKAQAAQDKAAAKLTELQNYRSTVNTLLAQQQQNEAAIKSQALSGLQTIAQAISNGTTVSPQIQAQFSSMLQNPGQYSTQYNFSQLPTGFVDWTKKQQG